MVTRSLNLAAIFLATTFLLVFSLNAFAQSPFTLSVDKTEVELGESIRLEFVYEGRVTSGQPNFNALKDNFTILDFQPSSSRIQINGNVTSTQTWTIYLNPKQTGRWLIPPISFNGATTAPTEITVKERGTLAQRKDVFLETSVDKKNAYITEQIMLVYKLYFASNLSGVSREPFDLNDATITEVDGLQYQERVNGRLYQVQEYRYILQSDVDGTLVIPNLNWQFRMPKSTSHSLFDRFGRQEILSQQSEEKIIRIKPIPKSFPKNETWLPLQSFKIEQNWSTNTTDVKPGEPQTRSIKIEALGVQSEKLPLLVRDETNSDVKIFVDTPEFNDAIGKNGFESSSVQSAALILSPNAKLELPAIRVPWWNTLTDKLEYAEIPATVITSLPDTNAMETQHTPINAEKNTNIPESQLTSELSSRQQPNEPSYWKVIALASLCVNVITILCLIVFLLLKLSSRQVKTREEHVKKPTKLSRIPELKQAEKAQDYQRIFSLTIGIIRSEFHTLDLDDFYKLCQKYEKNKLESDLRTLEKALFSSNNPQNLDDNVCLSTKLIELLQTVTQNKRNKKDLATFNPLEYAK